MNIIVLDHEVESYNKGNPFDVRNFAISCGTYIVADNAYRNSYFTDKEWKEFCRFDFSDFLLVAFNAKFDLHWCKRLKMVFPRSVWCCQLAYFYLTAQQHKFPSLDEVLLHYGLEPKLDVVKLEYWDKGLRTSDVPKDILLQYMKQDVMQTYQVYLKQVEEFKAQPQLYKLFRLACQDLLVLQEMEWNGLKLNAQLCHERATEMQDKIDAIEKELDEIYPNIKINWNSGDQLSAFLYGGFIGNEERYIDGVYGPKAAKVGQPRWKINKVQHALPRMVTPLKGSELSKEGFYSTDEPTLKQLKGNKIVKRWIGLLLSRAKHSTLLGHYVGLPQLLQDMCWPDSILHGQLNQVVANTGRLSATKPNQQNFAGDLQDVIITRF